MSLLTRHILSRQGLRPGEWRYGEFGPGGGSVCDSSDIALSSLVISDSSSSARAGCYGTDLAEASSVHLSPIAPSMRKLCGVSPLHPEGPRGGYSGLPRPSWWPFSRQNPLVTRFFFGVPLKRSDAVSFPRGTMVTYVTWDVFKKRSGVISISDVVEMGQYERYY